jgi:asparagine synthase (glutamine-hydrolysing)
VIDLLNPAKNVIHNMSVEEARAIVARGEPLEIEGINGHFALVGRDGLTVRMARTISRLMRYFIAKVDDGPLLVVSDRMDAIHRRLREENLHEQFHPSYTRLVPAHYLVELRLVGCPDPNPTYRRFFTPPRNTLPPDLDVIGERYLRAVYDEIAQWLRLVPPREPIGVCFSGGIDSGAIFLLTYHAMLSLGFHPGRLKAFTLVVEGQGDDLRQARAFLKAVDLEVFLEPIEAPASAVDAREAVRVIEDYKPLDVEAAAVNLALMRGIRRRHPDWKYLLDGDGGDENLKDYPIEENPELTIRSVLNNPLLYQEGWGVDSIKHSLTYSGGQSRGYARCYAPAAEVGFTTLSPFTAPSVIAVAEGIPFIALTEWDGERLYRLKGEITSRGVRRITGLDMPVHVKRRFQRGVIDAKRFSDIFPADPNAYRRMFHALHGGAHG